MREDEKIVLGVVSAIALGGLAAYHTNKAIKENNAGSAVVASLGWVGVVSSISLAARSAKA